MRSRYSQITVFVLNAISDVFTNVTYAVIIVKFECSSEVVETGQLSMSLVIISFEPLKIRPTLSYKSLRQKYSAWTLVCVGIYY